MLPLACVVAAFQMVVFTTVAGLIRPGYDPSRNWISQLSLGPGGWLADVNLVLCGLWLLIGAAGLGHGLSHPRPSWTGVGRTAVSQGGLALPVGRAVGLWGGLDRAGRWAAGLIGWCGACLIVLAGVRTDAGIGYPPGVPATHTTVGLVHQLVAVTLGVAGVAAAALLGRATRRPYAGMVVALVMAVTFVAASVLVVLDDAGVWPGNPSGLLERVALFVGLGWIGLVGLEVTVRGGPSGSSASAPADPNEDETAGAATETAPAAGAR
ncbi:DUF998 domain-containing protein [Paractinoplanes hotanensis]|uniref:DUF998 domain-containing protein n=1 Tax=Paractinoplanes hotanensis TaxID=2906497 RepID=A0ABT0XUZ7_9ACTN|nr:DUF998 domain-containing protein [Actinoplanes hotanensis]MCM4077460.1 DUF998 domain-containing protein [Actinoplanes hotanensis]